MRVSRRSLTTLVPALFAAAGRSAAAARLPAMVINRDDLPVRESAHTVQRRFFDGLTHEDIPVEAHETELRPGEAPHPPHRHAHEELAIVREGAIEVSMEGQAPAMVTAGGLVYVASNQLHGWKNVGDTPAIYMVIAIGRRG